ncbi:hypothetical protein CLV58_109175 [Spirosoma oryzae]|uniref:Uncharacterized protein n=1 Tax=Spirosoma oryzae TaxID=1469603 RepID=A0A2T0SYF7_9BACT|nr:hypothetical protein [Spirosoma oryzae]PRY38448.1 hypothetical protein CLV58_109175 [Spirosoma oryzae]
MNTRRDWIYQVRSRFRADTVDSRLSNRMISFELEKMLTLLIRRDSDSRKTWKQTNLFTRQLIELTTVDGRSRSVNPLPPIFQGSLNPYLQILGSDGTSWTLSTPLQQAGSCGFYGWLDNENYLVLTRPGITQIEVRYFGKPYRQPGSCQSELDVLLPVPDHLEEDLLTSVCKNLAAAPLPIPEDSFPNQNAQTTAPRPTA